MDWHQWERQLVELHEAVAQWADTHARLHATSPRVHAWSKIAGEHAQACTRLLHAWAVMNPEAQKGVDDGEQF